MYKNKANKNRDLWMCKLQLFQSEQVFCVTLQSYFTFILDGKKKKQLAKWTNKFGLYM